ncbi:MAG: hypothetical protein QW117_02055 [Candidatus Pacearchaeota archaeon]
MKRINNNEKDFLEYQGLSFFSVYNLANKNTIYEFKKLPNLLKRLCYKDGLIIELEEDLFEKIKKGEGIGMGAIYDKELGEILKKARTYEGKLKMLEEGIKNFLIPYIEVILRRTAKKYFEMSIDTNNPKELEKSFIARETLVSYQQGKPIIINGIIISKPLEGYKDLFLSY